MGFDSLPVGTNWLEILRLPGYRQYQSASGVQSKDNGVGGTYRDWDLGVTPNVHVYNSANQVIANNTVSLLLFDTEREDDEGFHSTSSNTGRLTVPTGLGGRYASLLEVRWEASAAGIREIWIQNSNGSTVIGDVSDDAHAAGGAKQMQVFGNFRLAAAEYLTAYVYQNSGGNLSVLASSAYGFEFSAWKISA